MTLNEKMEMIYRNEEARKYANQLLNEGNEWNATVEFVYNVYFCK